MCRRLQLEDYRDRDVLVVGMARTGIAVAKLLWKLGANVYINDMKAADQLGEEIGELEKRGIKLFLGSSPDELLEKVDMIVVSPGVPFDLPFITRAIDMGIEVVGEIELAYRMCKAPIIAITGTNGKTTTTMLVGEIVKAAGHRVHVVGNIGVPLIDRVMDIDSGDIVVLEVSSYQLESIDRFKPHIAAILNITEDHLDRHKTMENYIRIKGRIFENQDRDDYMVLNADDSRLETFSHNANDNLVMFSRKGRVPRGAWVENGDIVIDIGKGKQRICSSQDLFILGKHNLENALAAAAIAGLMEVDADIISTVLKDFRGVEHRIEYVDTIDGVEFYNDSKGTNPDAAIKAIEAMKGPTIIIAGGMDEGASFDHFIDAFGDRVVHMVVLGETADELMRAAEEKGFLNVHRVDSIEEAVSKAFSLAHRGENILLSPACASWDMFTSYEERGEVFKEAVESLRR